MAMKRLVSNGSCGHTLITDGESIYLNSEFVSEVVPDENRDGGCCEIIMNNGKAYGVKGTAESISLYIFANNKAAIK